MELKTAPRNKGKRKVKSGNNTVRKRINKRPVKKTKNTKVSTSQQLYGIHATRHGVKLQINHSKTRKNINVKSGETVKQVSFLEFVLLENLSNSTSPCVTGLENHSDVISPILRVPDAQICNVPLLNNELSLPNGDAGHYQSTAKPVPYTKYIPGTGKKQGTVECGPVPCNKVVSSKASTATVDEIAVLLPKNTKTGVLENRNKHNQSSGAVSSSQLWTDKYASIWCGSKILIKSIVFFIQKKQKEKANWKHIGCIVTGPVGETKIKTVNMAFENTGCEFNTMYLSGENNRTVINERVVPLIKNSNLTTSGLILEVQDNKALVYLLDCMYKIRHISVPVIILASYMPYKHDSYLYKVPMSDIGQYKKYQIICGILKKEGATIPRDLFNYIKVSNMSTSGLINQAQASFNPGDKSIRLESPLPTESTDGSKKAFAIYQALENSDLAMLPEEYRRTIMEPMKYTLEFDTVKLNKRKNIHKSTLRSLSDRRLMDTIDMLGFLPLYINETEVWKFHDNQYTTNDTLENRRRCAVLKNRLT